MYYNKQLVEMAKVVDDSAALTFRIIMSKDKVAISIEPTWKNMSDDDFSTFMSMVLLSIDNFHIDNYDIEYGVKFKSKILAFAIKAESLHPYTYSFLNNILKEHFIFILENMRPLTLKVNGVEENSIYYNEIFKDIELNNVTYINTHNKPEENRNV